MDFHQALFFVIACFVRIMNRTFLYVTVCRDIKEWSSRKTIFISDVTDGQEMLLPLMLSPFFCFCCLLLTVFYVHAMKMKGVFPDNFYSYHAYRVWQALALLLVVTSSVLQKCATWQFGKNFNHNWSPGNENWNFFFYSAKFLDNFFHFLFPRCLFLRTFIVYSSLSI